MNEVVDAFLKKEETPVSPTVQITNHFMAGGNISGSGHSIVHSSLANTDISTKENSPQNISINSDKKSISKTVIAIWVGVASTLIAAFILSKCT